MATMVPGPLEGCADKSNQAYAAFPEGGTELSCSVQAFSFSMKTQEHYDLFTNTPFAAACQMTSLLLLLFPVAYSPRKYFSTDVILNCSVHCIISSDA